MATKVVAKAAPETAGARLGLADRLKVYCWAALLAAWIFARRVAGLLWPGKVPNKLGVRENPPSSFVDSIAGRHMYVKLQGVKFHYVEAGDKTSPPLLLLHGFPDCWLGWEAQMTLLSVSYHVYALDLKGFGDSDKPGMRLHYSLPRLISELRSLLVMLADNPLRRSVTVLAHDLGGLLGWYLLHDSPGLIEKMVIVSAPHPNMYWETLSKTGLINYNWMCLAQIPWLPEREALKDDLVFLQQYCPHLKSSVLETYKYVFSRHEDWTGPLNYFRNLMFWRIPDDCSPINTPVLIVIGNKDPQIQLESMVRSNEWCTNAQVKIIEGGGHFPHQEYSEQFNRLLLKFLIREKERYTSLNKNPIEAGVAGAARGIVGRLFGAVHLFT